MNEFYIWLYEHYAAPQFRESEAAFPRFYQEQKREWLEAARRLSPRERLLSADLQNSLAACWGAAAFAHGVHVGLMLSAGSPEKLPERC